jgi:lysophospholipase L1-like esterase
MFIAGLAVAAGPGCGGTDSSPTNPSPPPGPGQNVSYTALGASDAVGVGASVPCFPFAPCPNGTGYVPVIARTLGQNRTVFVNNLGLPAAVIGPDIQRLGRQYGKDITGNFIEQELPFVPPDTTLVTIWAGGNDTRAIAAALEGGAGGSDPKAYINAQIRAFGADYDVLIRGIRQRALSPRIVVANLPNFAGGPFAKDFPLLAKQGLQEISVGMSVQVINRLTSQGISVIDLLCDPAMYDESSYSSDGFHPSDAGYAIMANGMLAAIANGSYPNPRSSCPEMALVPPP